MVAPGYLLENTINEFNDQPTLFGFGFGTEVPIDILGILLIGAEISEYNILLVDEFLRFNNTDESEIQKGLNLTIRVIEKLCDIYSLAPNIIVASEFMHSESYKQIHDELLERAKDLDLVERMLNTVPEKKRKEQGLVYPLNEAACVLYMQQELGIKLKIGPVTEQPYDEVIKDLEIDVDFSYMKPTYALATKSADYVVPYVPKSKGPNNGQRIYFEESRSTTHNLIRQVNDKIHGNEEALKYMLRLASAAGIRLRKNYYSNEEIEVFFGEKYLKKITRQLITKNVVEPYMEIT